MIAKGQVAEMMAGADGVEIKATIPDHQVEAAMRRYDIRRDDNQRYIYFFDTPDLKLFEAGIIGRARRIVGGKHDSTVKFRPIDPAAVPSAWHEHEGFKIEADTSDKGVVKSASLTKPVEKGVIKRVAAGDEPITSLFTVEQQLFLLSLANQHFDFSKVIVMGPVQAWRWKFTDPGLPWPITAELWQRDDGDLLCEASIKVPLVQAAAATAGFMAFLAESGAERDVGQQAKTRWFLEYYSPKNR
jgi:hypothetical protein